MKKIIGLIILILTITGLYSQDITGKYLNGKAVAAIPANEKITLENFAKIYKVKSAELAKYNGLNTDAIIAQGQLVLMPLAGLLQSNATANTHAIYHVVQPKEGLFRIGVNYGDIKMSELKSLNNLSGESVSIGQRLLIGYLPKYIPENIVAIAANTATEKTAMLAPNANTTDVLVKEIKPVSELFQTGAKNLQSTDLNVPDNSVSPKGFFENNYKETGIRKEGMAAIFKSTSGWADGKFYVLMNEVLPGTVIKITNPDNGNVLYARVVGDLPIIKKQVELLLRLSNAAASTLGISQADNFKLSINY